MKIRELVPKCETKFLGMIKKRKIMRGSKNGKIIDRSKKIIIGRNDNINIEKHTEYITPMGTISLTKIIYYSPSFMVKDENGTHRERGKEQIKIIGYRSNNDNLQVRYEYSYSCNFVTDKQANKEVNEKLKIDMYKNVLLKNACRLLASK